MEENDDGGPEAFSAYVGVDQEFPRSNLCNDKFQGIQWEAEKYELLKKIRELEGKVEEMKKQRLEDAKANEKVASIFAARKQQWKIEKSKLKNQVQIVLKQVRDLENVSRRCSECARKDEVIVDLEAKSLQLDQQLVRVSDEIECYERERKNFLDEKEEMRERFCLEIVQLQRDAEEKEAIICCLIRKSEEEEEVQRELGIAEARKLQGDWIGLEKSLHGAHIKQRRLEELGAFERQMRVKDERMEAFRRKLILIEHFREKLQKENESLRQSLQQAEAKTTGLEILLAEKNQAIGPKTSLRDSSLVWSCYDNGLNTLSDRFDEERDRIWTVEGNGQLKNLTEQDIQAFNCKCEITSMKGNHETREEKIEKSVSGSESNHPDDIPIVVDKHVSGTLNLGIFVHNQTQAKDVTPVKLQSGLGVLGQWKKGGATALVNLESKATSMGYSGQSKGKTVSEDDYLTYLKWGRAHKNVHSGETAEGQNFGQCTSCLQTVSGEGFLARKDDDLSLGANHYLKHILQGKDSSLKEVGVTVILAEVNSLEQELLQLEKIAKTEFSTRIPFKDEKPAMNGNTQNGHEKQQEESNQEPLSAIRLLKKQVKRYQVLIGKIDDLCKRMHDKDSVHSFNSSRPREQIAEELFLMETFEHQHCVVTMGQKLMAIESEIARNSCAFYNDLILQANFNMRQSIMVIKSHLKHIQRNLEIKLARIIGELEGTLARDGILHVMPVEWKKEHKTMLGKIEKGSRFSQVKL